MPKTATVKDKRPSSIAGLLLIIIPLLSLIIIIDSFKLATASTVAAKSEELPSGLFVARIYYDSISDINRLSAVDIWEYNNLQEKYVLAVMDATRYKQLSAEGWRLDLDHEYSNDIQQITNAPLFTQGGYRTVDQIYNYLRDIDITYPDLTELVDYGDSYCKLSGGCSPEFPPYAPTYLLPGYDLLALRITNENVIGSSTISATTIISGTKPIFFLMANLHAREITTPEMAMRMADWLLEGYGKNANATWLVDWHEIWIVPTANPDGHWLVELGEKSPYNGTPFYQRKNGNYNNGCTFWPPSSFDQYGVDLNRNHSFQWGSIGSSNAPCDPNYHGSIAASEPEVAQLQALIAAIFPDQRGQGLNDPAPLDTRGIFITLHSFSKLILWPWGFTNSPAPNKVGLQAIGDKLATYNGYYSCQPGLCLYSASGNSDDWVYGVLGIPAFTFELGSSFMPPYGEIETTQWPENGPALQYAAKIASAPYQLVNGPDVASITPTLTTRDKITLTAVIDDSQNGNQAIAGASFTVDVPYWVSGSISRTLTAVDGIFDTPRETVTAVLAISSLSPGQHTLFLRGQDNQGNWGPVNAKFIEIKEYFFPILLKQ